MISSHGGGEGELLEQDGSGRKGDGAQPNMLAPSQDQLSCCCSLWMETPGIFDGSLSTYKPEQEIVQA